MPGERKKNKAIFMDKDGTLLKDIPYNVDPERIDIYPDAIQGLQLLKSAGFLLILVSNQSGVAHGFFRLQELERVNDRIQYLLAGAGLRLDAFYYCPHHPLGNIKEYAILCNCRKPAPGLLLKASADLNIDLASSWMIGDILNDVEAGNQAFCNTIFIDRGNETEWRMTTFREPDFMAKDIREAAVFILAKNVIRKKDIVRL